MALFYYYDQNPFRSKMVRVSFKANEEAVFKLALSSRDNLLQFSPTFHPRYFTPKFREVLRYTYF